MRPLRHSINVTLDGCCDHRAIIPDEALHRHAVENLNQADALLLILRALQAVGWMVGGPSGAAARLGLKRTTLIAKMKKLGISRPVRQVEVAGLNQNCEPDSSWQPAAD